MRGARLPCERVATSLEEGRDPLKLIEGGRDPLTKGLRHTYKMVAQLGDASTYKGIADREIVLPTPFRPGGRHLGDTSGRVQGGDASTWVSSTWGRIEKQEVRGFLRDKMLGLKLRLGDAMLSTSSKR